ncbi:unnamed protein product [marine sediment metagenome]|uniref:DegV family protein n=1 Tax=marine sediment metagenome TaxID=412755 RepID=X1AMW6_9ZZZZ
MNNGGWRSVTQKVAIVTDSIACLTKEIVAQYGIRIVPLNFYSEGKVYKDWVDITPAEAYELFLKDPESFKTSAASPEDCLKAYREASKQTKNILCITISAKLSAVYNVTQGAKEQARIELPQTSIEVLDSQTATAAEGFIALAAARAAAEGKSLAEVIKAAEGMRDRVSLLALMDTVRYVYRTGRVPKVAALAGSMLAQPVYWVPQLPLYPSALPLLLRIWHLAPSVLRVVLIQLFPFLKNRPV